MGINDAATPETVLLQDVLHHKVVMVGVHSDIIAMFEAPLEAGVGYSLLLATGGHTVNNVVWFVVQPVAVINAGIAEHPPYSIRHITLAASVRSIIFLTFSLS